jgi:hypothetical protein
MIPVLVLGAPALIVALMLAGGHAYMERPPVRERRQLRAQRRIRRKRREERSARLEHAGATVTELEQLSELVEGVHEHRGDASELEHLLDRYVDLATARQRCLDTLTHIDPPLLEARLAHAKQVSAPSAGILERRAVLARWLSDRAWQLHDAIVEIAETVRYSAECQSRDEVLALIEGDDDAVTYHRALDAIDRELHGGECVAGAPP